MLSNKATKLDTQVNSNLHLSFTVHVHLYIIYRGKIDETRKERQMKRPFSHYTRVRLHSHPLPVRGGHGGTSTGPQDWVVAIH